MMSKSYSNTDLKTKFGKSVTTLDKFIDNLYFFDKWPSVKDYKENPNLIFVFGSNTDGLHGAGAAKFAFDYLNAEMGKAEGITGQTYALPTKKFSRYAYEQLVLIQSSIIKFYQFVIENKDDNNFYILTAIGTGLSEVPINEIANVLRNQLLSLKKEEVDCIREKVIFSSDFKSYFI